jgi:hypothetical protein
MTILIPSLCIHFQKRGDEKQFDSLITGRNRVSFKDVPAEGSRRRPYCASANLDYSRSKELNHRGKASLAHGLHDLRRSRNRRRRPIRHGTASVACPVRLDVNRHCRQPALSQKQPAQQGYIGFGFGSGHTPCHRVDPKEHR